MDSFIILSLVFFPMIMAFAAYYAGRVSDRARCAVGYAAGVCELALALLACFAGGGRALTCRLGDACSLGLGFEIDGFRRVYCVVIAFMWMMTLLFSTEYFKNGHRLNRYYFFNLVTLGATMGVFMAADLMTAFVFFEMMSFTSFVWVIQEETPGAIKAANTYIAVAVIGGMAALMGLFLLYNALGTLELSQLADAAAAYSGKGRLLTAGVCILFGFGAKAGMFPMHIWLPKAHPVAPAPASALLSGILTKTGIWGILAITVNIFAGSGQWGVLMAVLAAITMLLGAVLALFSVDLKRTLACSSMSQIGFVLTGVAMMSLLGEENAIAARGTLLHMLNHSLIKLCLFMCAGCVYMNLHSLNLNDVRGFGRKQPVLMLSFLMGALGIGGIPMWNGYVSKTLLHESIVEYTKLAAEAGKSVFPVKTLEWIFLISGGITIAYMMKLFVCIFVEKNHARQAEYDEMRKYMTPRSAFAIAGSAVIMPVLGFTAGLTMDRLADIGTDFFGCGVMAERVKYFSLENLKGALISIVIGCAVYFVVVRKLLMDKNGEYKNRWPVKLDLEELVYRPLLLKILPGALGAVTRVFGENRILTPVCEKAMEGGEYAVCVFGENKVLTPVCAGIMTAVRVVTRALGDALDACVVLLRKTVYKEYVQKSDDHLSKSAAYRIGHRMDVRAVRRHKEKKGGEKYAETLVRAEASVKRTWRMLSSNLAMALLALCAAICFVLLYVLIVHG